MLTYRHLLHAFEAAGAHQGVVYLSAPITSGLRELALMRELDVTTDELQLHYRERWKTEVIRQNELVAHAHADRQGAHLPDHPRGQGRRMSVRTRLLLALLAVCLGVLAAIVALSLLHAALH